MRRQEGREAARNAREQRVERRHQQASVSSSTWGSSAVPESAQSAWPSFSFVMPSFFAEDSAELADSELPPTLQELRHLEKENLRPGELFCRQARLAAKFEDSLPFEGFHPYRYLPTYKDLGNRELRGYFTWRASWRRGTAGDAPATYVTILAFELINGVGAPRGPRFSSA